MNFYCPTRFEIPFRFQLQTQTFGMGPRAGESLAQQLNTQTSQSPIVVFGCAGALKPQLKAGDVFVVSEVIYKDQKFTLNPLPGLPSARVYSSDKLIKSGTLKQSLYERHQTELVEMEMGAILSSLNPLLRDKLIFIRGVVDTADEGLKSTFDWLRLVRALGPYHREMGRFLSQLNRDHSR